MTDYGFVFKKIKTYLLKIMTNIYKGPIIKLVGKVLLSVALYSIAAGLTKKIWS